MVPRLELIGITKRYPPQVLANDVVSLSFAAGEIHGLIGENGAGKSTLMRITAGAIEADAGEIRLDGRAVHFASPAAARAAGVVMVHQHFAVFESLSVLENILLALPRGTKRQILAARITALGQRHGLVVDPSTPMHALSVGQRQRVELLRALMLSPRLLVLDEPTSMLPPAAVDGLFDALVGIAAEGTAILYASHKLAEVQQLCSRVTVLRAGRVIGQCDPRGASLVDLSRMMFGELGELGDTDPDRPRPPSALATGSAPLLEVRGLTLAPLLVHGAALHDIDLVVDRHQIVGLAGIAGNGQAELVAALVGEDCRAPARAIRFDGRAIGHASVRQRRDAGLGHVPEDRLGTATLPELGLDRNLLLTHDDQALFRAGLIRDRVLAERTGSVIAEFDVRAAGPKAPARTLSGGNLQKYVLGRELAKSPSLLIAVQPTWGVDAGAARRIHLALRALRDDGAGVLVVAEDLEELFALADVLVVISNGRVSAPIAVADATLAGVGGLMSGQEAESGHEAAPGHEAASGHEADAGMGR